MLFVKAHVSPLNILMPRRYGDLYPDTKEFKIVWSIYLLFGLCLVASLMGAFTAKLWVWQYALVPSGKQFSRATREMLTYLAGFCFIHVIGLVFFEMNEPLVDWWQSFDHTIVTLTTVGYGDGPFGKPSTKAFTIGYIFIGVSYTAFFFSSMVAWIAYLQHNYNFNKLQRHDVGHLAYSLRTSMRERVGKQTTDRHEFVMYALQQGGRVTLDDVKLYKELFEKLDTNDSGYLSEDEVE